MPVFNHTSALPEWCELRHVARIELDKGNPLDLAIDGPRDRLLVTLGQVMVETDYGGQTLVQGQFIDLDPARTDRVRLVPVIDGAEVLNFCGRWGDTLGGCGVFSVVTDPVGSISAIRSTTRSIPGSTAISTTATNTGSSSAGRGVAVIENEHYPVGAGDCVAIGRGFHHDFPQVSEPIRAAYFETTLEGLRRPGHLWMHTNGPASPDPRRR